ncbi:MAG: substrate-binding domain-containing protein [Prochloraceae cyanobacterium]|nr:substrate-binding domain-containing protein [Prochloraceae cyanobacterium]
MTKLVVLQISKNLNKNYWVNLRISEPDREPFVQVSGTLPLADLTIEQYQKWHKSYQQLSYFIKLKTKIDRLADSVESEICNYVNRQKQINKQDLVLLKERFDRWLKAPGFRHITRIIRQELARNEEILFLICASSLELKQLPWHLWSLIKSYPLAEIIISPENKLFFDLSTQILQNNLKILAILGNVSETDFLKYKQELNERFPRSKITCIDRTKLEKINNFLKKYRWDILFFNSDARSNEYQRIFGNIESGNITLDRIKDGLKIAKENGLKLAIFNIRDSWQGVELLEKINVDRTIVMREIISDRAAREFLISFLTEFIQTNSLTLAVCAARKKLKTADNLLDLSWFPILYQSNAQIKNKIYPQYITLQENSNSSNGRKVYSIIDRGVGIKTKLESRETERVEKLIEPIAKEPEKEREIPKVLPEKESLPQINKTQSPQQENHPISWNKTSLIGLIALIFIGTKIYTIVFSFIVMRFFENSNIIPTVASSPEMINLKSHYQKKATFSDIEKVPSGLFRYGGSASWAKIRDEVNPKIASVWPNFQLVYTKPTLEASNSDMAIRMLLDSQLSFAQLSRPLKPEEHQQALDKKIELQQMPIAIDAIVFAVHPDLNISGLTLAQLRDIYTGKITNWQELGGPDLSIAVYSKSPFKSGSAEFFQKQVLNNRNFSERVKIVDDIDLTLKQVSRNRGAIFYASASHIVLRCAIKPLAIGRNFNNLIYPYRGNNTKAEKCQDPIGGLNFAAIQNSTYPLSRYLYLIVKKSSYFDRLAGEAYVNLLISQEGQNLIEASGFVPIH